MQIYRNKRKHKKRETPTGLVWYTNKTTILIGLEHQYDVVKNALQVYSTNIINTTNGTEVSKKIVLILYYTSFITNLT